MKELFSTNDVEPRHRFDYWHEVACKRIVGHESAPKSRLKFEASIASADLPGMTLILFENAPMKVVRTAQNIAHGGDDCVLVCRPVKGKLCLQQNGQESLLKPGEFTVIDPQRPYEAEFVSNSKMLVIKVPRRALEKRFDRIAEVSTHVVGREHRMGALASDYLALLPRYAAAIDGTTATALTGYTLDIVALALGGLSQNGVQKQSPARATTASKLRVFIESQLDDPMLNPSTVANGTGIGLRYAQAVLADEGTTIVRLIQARRLEQCERALGSDSQKHRTVGEIAFAWGFTDLTHFGRLFKKRFRMTPGEYRRYRLNENNVNAKSR